MEGFLRFSRIYLLSIFSVGITYLIIITIGRIVESFSPSNQSFTSVGGIVALIMLPFVSLVTTVIINILFKKDFEYAIVNILLSICFFIINFFLFIQIDIIIKIALFYIPTILISTPLVVFGVLDLKTFYIKKKTKREYKHNFKTYKISIIITLLLYAILMILINTLPSNYYIFNPY
ncbi:hypothetical protein C0583_02535 [Candidatus Parcubacteria bacterium]|nr:MAG: hypothetical protein C0583_02535 [Candidatus Parcubacteria bacterium]